MLERKINQICRNPFHNYHRLHGEDHDKHHVHVDSSFVLVFRIDHDHRAVELLDFDHHRKVFKE